MFDVFNDVSKCKYRRNGLANGKIHKTLPKLHYNKDGQLVIRGNNTTNKLIIQFYFHLSGMA